MTTKTVSTKLKIEIFSKKKYPRKASKTIIVPPKTINARINLYIFTSIIKDIIQLLSIYNPTYQFFDQLKMPPPDQAMWPTLLCISFCQLSLDLHINLLSHQHRYHQMLPNDCYF